jgi:hypothetical protein
MPTERRRRLERDQTPHAVSRHKGLDTLRGYVRRVDLFKEHAGAAFVTGERYAFLEWAGSRLAISR